jgi:hypothetical protein
MSVGGIERFRRSILYGSTLPFYRPFVAEPIPTYRRSASLGHSLTLFLGQAIGGAVWHGVKGFRNSPYGERRIGALTAIKARAPVLGGNFGVWGGLFSTFDCAVKGIRKKEDPYNASTCATAHFDEGAIRNGMNLAR